MTLRLEDLIFECEDWLILKLPAFIRDATRSSTDHAKARTLLIGDAYFFKLYGLLKNVQKTKATRLLAEYESLLNAIEQDANNLDGRLDAVEMHADHPLRPALVRKTLRRLLGVESTSGIKSASSADTGRDGDIVGCVEKILAEFKLLFGFTRDDQRLKEYLENNPEMLLAFAFREHRDIVLSICHAINGRDADRAYTIVGLCINLQPATVRKIYERRKRGG